MTDNTTISANGTPVVIADDDLSGVHYPRSKVVWGVDGVATDASVAAPLPVQAIGSGSQIGSDLTASFALNVAAGTAATGTAAADITNPSPLQPDGLYVITVYNPSTQTALTVAVQNKETLASSARYAELTRFGVAANSSISVIVQGWFVAEAGRLAVTNDTGSTLTAFSATIRIRRV